MRRRRLVWLLFAFLVAPSVTTAARASSTPLVYVALGDSYTSGPLIPLYEQPYGCLRSTLNYPHLIAGDLGYSLRDASCAGAETDDMTAAQGVTPGPNPPQFDRLGLDTDIVTLQIGGNDIGFSSIAESCGSLTPTGHPCQDTYVVGGVDEISRRIADTAPKVGAVLDGIHAHAPNARVLVVPYIAIFPAGTPIMCWPQLPVAYDDVPYLRAKQMELNQMLATQAAAHGATFVDVYALSVPHDSCEVPGVRWVEPLVPANLAAPVHPNVLGMLGVAKALEAVLSSAG